MERRAQAAESLATEAAAGKDALNNAINSAEMYMRAAEEAGSKADAARLRRKCQDMITYAERLKGALAVGADSVELPATRPSPFESTSASILRLGSQLHGNDFPAWKESPGIDEFELLPGQDPFTDDTEFSLSTNQIDNFAAWVRPPELFNLIQQHDRTTCEDAMMQVSDHSDLMQDITTDCSVVASLSAAFNVLTGKHAVLSSILHPYDLANNKPRLSPSGKYVMKLNFNGCARKVIIDDRLPSSRTDRALFVVDKQNPFLLWPALLEKAYLKVRGGYDFPGSNSGTDLWVLIGWIPEQLFLQREDIDLENIWERIRAAHKSGDVVITLGTGRVSAEEEEVMGLIGEHDYAVENLDTSGFGRRLLIKNPWCHAPSMTALEWPDSASSPTLSKRLNAAPSRETLTHYSDSTSRLWVTFEDVAQHFESMYLNWNPALFPCRQDHHFSWELPAKVYSASLSRNPQFSVTSPRAGSIWVLVSRHFVDAELDIARERRDSMAAAARQLGFMSVSVFKNGGKKLQIGGGELYRGPYVDSHQTLARLVTEPGQPYTIVVDQHELPLPRYNFTMSLFSHSPLEVREALENMSQFTEQLGAWTRRTAGGNSSCGTFFQNPQYNLSIKSPSPVSILLCADAHDVHVHVDVIWGQGRRVTAVRVKDLVASSGEYRRGCAVADITMLEPGTYTIVCSTFEAGQLGNFSMRVAAMVPASITPVPADGAGKLLTRLPRVHLREGDERFRLPVDVSRLTRASVSLNASAPSQLGSKMQAPSSQVVRVSVVHRWGPEQVTIAVSGENEFQDPGNPIRTPQFDMEPDRIQRDGLWILLESMGSHGAALAIDGEILSDSPVRIGGWETA
ncbi:Cysteine protease rim-13 [Metarhizium album ARSEF 1941]|uniref:Cysteine protease rim-13 n=1 Tax=Metarhizium album (strain ARSEF 1941) TaxID=1081103 RepID=A0A0B2X5Z6_METAS|nr:Cysteine protease rim-13 [Metarhizium album ARSEF 1941]KHO00880.1 Cysteine protease rim-13 [Metarhizium album ARSEF 1941]